MKRTELPAIGETLYTAELPNGLPIRVMTKPGFRRSFAVFATNYGGADRRFTLGGRAIETPAGVAHYLEHKMFDTPDGDALMTLNACGADPNAFTSMAMTAYHFSCTDRFEENLRTLLIGCHIVSHHLADICYVNTKPAQICGRLKGTHTCLSHKVIGVDQYTCIDHIRLIYGKVDIIIKILQDLSDHLACRRRIRLNIGKLCLTDRLLSDPVMIEHNDRTGLRQKRRALGITRTVGVNNHQNRVRPDRLVCLPRRNDHICRISFFRCKTFPERLQ